MLAFILVGSFSDNKHVSTCLWESELPGTKAAKDAKKMTPAPTLNQAEI
jgi:hypothetical protein